MRAKVPKWDMVWGITHAKKLTNVKQTLCWTRGGIVKENWTITANGDHINNNISAELAYE